MTAQPITLKPVSLSGKGLTARVISLDVTVVRSAAVPARVNAPTVVLPRRVISNHRHRTSNAKAKVLPGTRQEEKSRR